MTTEIIRTIQDMERLYYSAAGQQLLDPDDLNAPFISKADAPVLTSTTGVFNAVFGMQAWVQLNQEANTFGALPKAPWRRSGWRVISARSTALPFGGLGEAGTLPDSVKPTFSEVSTIPTTVAVVFENSEVHEYLAADGGDDVYAQMQDLRTYMAAEHKENINVMLNGDGGDVTAPDNFESVDRIFGSFAELSAFESDQSTSYSAGDLDIYGLDRDAGASFADAFVDDAAQGALRALTDSRLQSLLQNTLANGANPNGQWFQMGYDSWSAVNQLYEPQVRYNLLGSSQIKVGVNGIETQDGVGVGLNVATLFAPARPVIQSKDTLVDTGGISRIYLYDTSNPEGYDYPRLYFKIAKPTQYFEAGINQGTPFAVNKFSNKGMYRTMGEVICSFFAVQGKLRDLK
ncbi:hypothetical protein IIA15_01100 [candidate division TA06 bacterium]|nr:hypothetical protein [candidate division TA06 bacterium]